MQSKGCSERGASKESLHQLQARTSRCSPMVFVVSVALWKRTKTHTHEIFRFSQWGLLDTVIRLRHSTRFILEWYSLQSCYTAQGSHWNDTVFRMRRHRIHTDMVVCRFGQSIMKWYGLQSCYTAQGSHWNDTVFRMRRHRIHTDMVVCRFRQSIMKWYGLQSCYTAQGSHWNDTVFRTRRHRIHNDMVVCRFRQSIMKWYGLQSCYTAQGSYLWGCD